MTPWLPASLRGHVDVARAQLLRPEIAPAAQRGYELERIRELSCPIASALMEGGFIGVVADKIYGVHPAALALISAAPLFGNLSSFLWARLAQGRSKIPFITAMQLAFLCFVASIALLPEGPLGGVLLVVSLVASRLLLGGIITLRSLVWTLNYPGEVRGRVTARLAMLLTFTLTTASLAGGALLDADPGSFRLIYAGAALLALVGVIAFSRIRIIDEAAHLEVERGEAKTFRVRSLGMLGMLREDPTYARYLSWQFLLGTSNMMLEGPLIYLVSRELGANYVGSIAITLVIPLALALLTIPLWAIYIDRVHIVQFRSRHSWLFAASQFCLFLGALFGSLPMIAFSRVVLGLARGGGMLAWQLGHNDFADRDRVGLYMGVHVTLTGVRGAFAPFLGMLLYVGWSSGSWPGSEIGGFEGIHSGLMLLACVLSSLASAGFVSMHRQLEQQTRRVSS